MDTARLVELIALVETETGARAVTLETRLDSIVSDSLEFLSLISAVENAFNFRVPDKQYQEVQTVGDLYSYVPDYVPS